jgi:hypothetical protein
VQAITHSSLVSNSTPSFYVSMGLLSGFLSTVSLTGIWNKNLVHLMLATCPTHFILLDMITLIIFDEEYKYLTFL